MYAGKSINGNPISTKRLKLYGVGPVDNRPSTKKDRGLIHLWPVTLVIREHMLDFATVGYGAFLKTLFVSLHLNL